MTSPDTEPTKCPKCHGKGWHKEMTMTEDPPVSVPCKPCKGTGRTPDTEPTKCECPGITERELPGVWHLGACPLFSHNLSVPEPTDDAVQDDLCERIEAHIPTLDGGNVLEQLETARLAFAAITAEIAYTRALRRR